MTIDPTLGLIQWTPTSNQLGNQNVEVKVQDAHGLFALQGYTAQVVSPVTVPDVVGQPQDSAVALITAAGLTVGTITADGSPTVPFGSVISLNPAAATLAVPGAAVNIVVSLGPVPTNTPTSTPTITPTATDTPTITPTPAGPPPIDTISGPADGTIVTAPIDIIGTANSDTLLSWTLDYQLAGDPTFTTISASTTPVMDGVLGRFDPTLLLNGIYELRLTVVDISGRTAITETTVAVDGNQKVGTFALSYLDVSVPLVGLPIQITRTYDSRDKRTDDFGVGWSLGLRNVRLQENSVLGFDWSGTRDFVTFCTEPARPHLVTITLPDNSVHQFEAGVTPHCQGLEAPTLVDLTFAPRPNTTSRLEPLDVTSALVFGPFPGDVELLDFDTLAPVDPNLYKLTLPDGRAFVIDQQLGLQSITDLNGNVLTVNANGITHSSGTGVSFQRDAQDRIIKITDPMGQLLTYSYNAAGDLVSVTDQLNQTTTFTYNGSHGLLSIQDPLGRLPTRYEYDAEGRAIGVTDANGHTIALSHDLGANQDVITDRLGNVSVVEYDARGNVTKHTDPLGHVTSLTYDTRDNKLSETDPLGNTRTYTYDANDNLLTETDPLGNVTTHTYDSGNRELTRTDPRGGTVSRTYDSLGNLLTRADQLDHTTVYTYDARGSRLSTADPLANTWTYAYDSRGNQTHATDPLGNVTDRTFGANGHRLTETSTRLFAGAPQAATRSYEYDARNRLTRITDPEGGVTRTAYTPTGKLASKTDPLGRVTTYTYDEQDRLVTTAHADGTTETFGYDVEGRVTSLTDRAGRVTTFAYDAAGRQVSTTYPDGSTVEMGHDAANRRTSETDENGGVTTFVYDAAGRNTSTEDPLNDTMASAYDGVGNLTSRTDRNGHTTAFTYDLTRRLTRTTFPDSTSTSATYDDAGRRLTMTDQAGNVTGYAYDARGNLTMVTDALNGQTQYTYDALAFRISQTDALGNVMRFGYDRIGRQLTRTLPLGQVETRTYDLAGNLSTLQNFNGQTTTYTYDTMSRLLRRALPGGENHDYTYTPTGKLATLSDGLGTTTFTYDLRDRPTLMHQPDRTEVHYAYDAHGNRSKLTTPAGTTTYTYDPAHRLASLTDPQNNQTVLNYDAQGNLTGMQYANGVTATYAYNTLDRLTGLTQSKGGMTIRSYAYTLGPTGNRTRVIEDTGRQVDYTYDPLFRLTQEAVTPPGGGSTAITSYTYDANGNRLSKIDGAGTTLHSYDANSRLLTAGSTMFTYDANGNLLSQAIGGDTTSYQYDALNRLTQVTAPDGAATQYTYDGLNNRVRKVDAADTVNFLVDPFGHEGTSLPVERSGCCGTSSTPLLLPEGARPSFGQVGLPQVLRETDAASNAVNYVYAGTTLLSQERGGNGSFDLPDGQMSTRLLADTTGSVTDGYDYDAFGNLIAQSGTTPNIYLYNGQQFDPNAGLYYLRARYYDPSQGRFTGRDPFPGRKLDPTTLHPYVYAANDPVNRMDPTGRDWDLASVSASLASFGNLVTTAVVSQLARIYTTLFVTSSAGILVEHELETADAELPELPAAGAAVSQAGGGVFDEATQELVVIEQQNINPGQIASLIRALGGVWNGNQEPEAIAERLQEFGPDKASVLACTLWAALQSGGLLAESIAPFLYPSTSFYGDFNAAIAQLTDTGRRCLILAEGG